MLEYLNKEHSQYLSSAHVITRRASRTPTNAKYQTVILACQQRGIAKNHLSLCAQTRKMIYLRRHRSSFLDGLHHVRTKKVQHLGWRTSWLLYAVHERSLVQRRNLLPVRSCNMPVWGHHGTDPFHFATEGAIEAGLLALVDEAIWSEVRSSLSESDGRYESAYICGVPPTATLSATRT